MIELAPSSSAFVNISSLVDEEEELKVSLAKELRDPAWKGLFKGLIGKNISKQQQQHSQQQQQHSKQQQKQDLHTQRKLFKFLFKFIKKPFKQRLFIMI